MKINHTAAVGVVSALVGAGAGSVVTFFVTRQKLREAYDVRLETELDKTKKFYERHEKKGDFADPVSAAKALLGDEADVEEAAVVALESYVSPNTERPEREKTDPRAPRNGRTRTDYSGITPAEDKAHPAEEDGVVIEKAEEVEVSLTSGGEQVTTFTEELRQEIRTHNVFAEQIVQQDDENFSYEEELAKRERLDPNAPRIIHHDEFMQNLPDYQQSTLTYYERDDTLVDERDTPITDEDKLVGSDNLVRFGHGSKDQHVVYVRNPRLEIDFEITRSVGSYAQEVLGVDDSHLEHSAARRPPTRFRLGVDE